MTGDFNVNRKEFADIPPQTNSTQPCNPAPQCQKTVPMVSDDVQKKTEAEAKKPLKASDLDYSVFPKANRLDASEFAERSINEVKDLAREFNKDFPYTPYIVDYETFPKPEEYTSKKYGGKTQAYMAWKSAVKEWVEDCKQDMDARKDIGLQDMATKFETVMNTGFCNIYMQNGLTQQEIYEVYQALNGDINKVKVELDARIGRAERNIKDAVGDQANWVVGNVHGAAAGIHHHIDEVDQASTNRDSELSDKIDDVQVGVDQTNEKLDKQAEEAKERENLTKEIGIAWHNAPKKVENVVRKYLEDKGYRFDKDGHIWRGINDLVERIRPSKDNTYQTVIENLSLAELRDIRELIKRHINDDPLVH